MKKASLPALLLLVPLALAQSGGAFNIAHFSATMEMASPGGGATMAMKIYKSGDKTRTDLPNGTGYTVTDVSTHKTFMVMGGGMCMEMSPAMAGRSQPNPFAAQGQVQTQSLGSETVDGHACQVEQITVTPASGPPQVMKAWLATDLQNFPVRVEMQTARGPMQINYKDISLAPPDATLFAQPSGCRAMPGIPHR